MDKELLILKNLIAFLTLVKPFKASQLEKGGFTLKRLGSGFFRATYEVVGANVVVKFPKNDRRAACPYDENIDHAVAEHEAAKRLLRNKKYKTLHRYVPEILYFDKKTGVMVMRKYEKVNLSRTSETVANILEDLIFDLELMEFPDQSDIWAKNFGICRYKTSNDHERLQYKIIDLGLFDGTG